MMMMNNHIFPISAEVMLANYYRERSEKEYVNGNQELSKSLFLKHIFHQSKASRLFKEELEKIKKKKQKQNLRDKLSSTNRLSSKYTGLRGFLAYHWNRLKLTYLNKLQKSRLKRVRKLDNLADLIIDDEEEADINSCENVFLDDATTDIECQFNNLFTDEIAIKSMPSPPVDHIGDVK